MARHYTTKDFFRQMPNGLLARYFQVRELFGDLDFSAMKEGKPDELFAVWLHLPEGQRNAMDAEFRDIFDMSCEKGFRAIIDEAEFQLGEDEFTAWVEKLSALPNHYERAMLVFLAAIVFIAPVDDDFIFAIHRLLLLCPKSKAIKNFCCCVI